MTVIATYVSLIHYKVLHILCSSVPVSVNPSPYPSLGTSDGCSPHIGHRVFLTDDDLIQTIRLTLFPLVMASAWCLCLPRCNRPRPLLWVYFCFHNDPGSWVERQQFVKLWDCDVYQYPCHWSKAELSSSEGGPQTYIEGHFSIVKVVGQFMISLQLIADREGFVWVQPWLPHPLWVEQWGHGLEVVLPQLVQKATIKP